VLEKFFSNDETDAIRSPATARICFVIIEIESVIEGDLFASQDIAPRDNPYPPVFQFRVAIGRATVVEIARRIPIQVAIQVFIRAEGENKLIIGLTTPERFLFADALSQVLDDSGIFGDWLPGKPA
jgi:hypothetical protein